MTIKTLLNKVNQDYTGKEPKELENYAYIVKANDKFLSGWGESAEAGHCQLVLCDSAQTARKIINGMEKDDSLTFVNWHVLKHFTMNKHRTHTLRLAENCPVWLKD